RLIESQAGQVLPVMAAVNASMQELANSISTIVARDEEDRSRDRHIYDMLLQLVRAHDGSEEPGERRGNRHADGRSRAAGRATEQDHGPDSGDNAALSEAGEGR